MRKRVIRFFLFLPVLLLCLFDYFRPTVVLHAPADSDWTVSYLMDFYDRHYDGSLSDWYVEMLDIWEVTEVCWRGGRLRVKFPLLYDRRADGNLVFRYHREDGENERRGGDFGVNGQELYFFRRDVYLDGDGEIEQYLRKYPWSAPALVDGVNSSEGGQ